MGQLGFPGPIREAGGTYECHYQLAGMGLGIPNAVTGSVGGGAPQGKSSLYSIHGLRLNPVGWFGTATPNPVIPGRDFEVTEFSVSTGIGILQKDKLMLPKNPGDPDPTRDQRVNPGSHQQMIQQPPAIRQQLGPGQIAH